MIDRNGDGRITYEEFLASAKEARVDEQRIATRSMEVVEVLTRISEYMKREVRWAGWGGGERRAARAAAPHAGGGGAWWGCIRYRSYHTKPQSTTYAAASGHSRYACIHLILCPSVCVPSPPAYIACSVTLQSPPTGRSGLRSTYACVACGAFALMGPCSSSTTSDEPGSCTHHHGTPQRSTAQQASLM